MPVPPSSGTLVDASTLAANLGLTVGQIYRLSASGRIPKYKAGHRTVRFDLEEVRAALRASPASPTPLLPRRREAASPASPPVHDLPRYDWSSTMPAGATLPPADRRG